MTLSFGRYAGIRIDLIPSSYLCWVHQCYKGGFKATAIGEPHWNGISMEEFAEVKRELQRRGYNTKGIVPVKE